MSATTDLSRAVRELTDRQALTELVSRLYVLLYEECFDELRSVYTDDVHLEFPSATMDDIDEVIAVAAAEVPCTTARSTSARTS